MVSGKLCPPWVPAASKPLGWEGGSPPGGGGRAEAEAEAEAVEPGGHTAPPLEAQPLLPAAFSPAKAGVLLAWWRVRRL